MAVIARQDASPALTPDYLSYTVAPQLLVIDGTLTGLAVFTFILRVYVRASMLRVFGTDDYLMLAAVVMAVGVLICIVGATHHGFGKHILAISPQDIGPLLHWLWWYSILIVVAVSLIKLSIGFFLLRLAQRTQYRRFIYGVILFLVFFTLSCVGTLIFQCVPVSAAWNFSLKPPPFGTGTAKCFSNKTYTAIGLFNSCTNIATDVLFATLPIPMVWKLQVNVRTKISLIAILSLGFFACAAAIIKTPLLYHFFQEKDLFVHGAPYFMWQMVEMNVGIMAGCLPSLKPFFNWLLETAKALTTGSYNRTRPSDYKRTASLGYFKQQETLGRSVELGSIPSQTTQSDNNSAAKSPYAVRATSGVVSPYGQDVASHSLSLSNDKTWEMERAKTSDDSILPLRQGHGGIVRTTEVTVS